MLYKSAGVAFDLIRFVRWDLKSHYSVGASVVNVLEKLINETTSCDLVDKQVVDECLISCDYRSNYHRTYINVNAGNDLSR